MIEKEPDKTLELILFLQGNIFLLKNLKFELLEKLTLISSAKANNYTEYYWGDFMYDADVSIADLITDVSKIFDSIEEYFDFETGGDWDGDFDFD